MLKRIPFLSMLLLAIVVTATPKMLAPSRPVNSEPDSKLGKLCKIHFVQIWAGLDWCLDEYDPPIQPAQPMQPAHGDYCFTDRLERGHVVPEPVSIHTPAPTPVRPTLRP